MKLLRAVNIDGTNVEKKLSGADFAQKYDFPKIENEDKQIRETLVAFDNSVSHNQFLEELPNSAGLAFLFEDETQIKGMHQYYIDKTSGACAEMVAFTKDGGKSGFTFDIARQVMYAENKDQTGHAITAGEKDNLLKTIKSVTATAQKQKPQIKDILGMTKYYEIDNVRES
jgi:hypothetical protein